MKCRGADIGLGQPADGAFGIGKTSLGWPFWGQQREQPALHFGFYETPERLRQAASLVTTFAAMEQGGALQLCWQPTTEGLLDQVGARLLERGAGSKRVLIDSLGAFSRLAIDPARSMRSSAPWPVSCARVMSA
jgi:circadian clock protein KaiC